MNTPPSLPPTMCLGFCGSIQRSCQSPCVAPKPPTCVKLLPPSSLAMSAPSVLNTGSGFEGSIITRAKYKGRQTIHCTLPHLSHVLQPTEERHSADAVDST